MSGLRKKLLELNNRKEELIDCLNGVEISIEQVKLQIAKEEKLIRHCDFIVTVDPSSGTWVLKAGKGCLVTHRLTGIYNYCNSFNSAHTNKNQAYANVIESLTRDGWKVED